MRNIRCLHNAVPYADNDAGYFKLDCSFEPSPDPKDSKDFNFGTDMPERIRVKKRHTPRTLTGRIALWLGKPKRTVRNYLFVAAAVLVFWVLAYHLWLG